MEKADLLQTNVFLKENHTLEGSRETKNNDFEELETIFCTRWMHNRFSEPQSVPKAAKWAKWVPDLGPEGATRESQVPRESSEAQKNPMGIAVSAMAQELVAGLYIY